MSRAFVRETDSDNDFDLPERPVSEHPNPVTLAGLRQIENTIADLEAARQQARSTEEMLALAQIERDLRYWVQRRASAQLTETESVPDKVRFGVTVALEFADGTQKNFTLVGEDEADPNAGLISWISPVAQALLGREVGDEIELPSGRAEIIGLSNTQLQ